MYLLCNSLSSTELYMYSSAQVHSTVDSVITDVVKYLLCIRVLNCKVAVHVLCALVQDM